MSTQNTMEMVLPFANDADTLRTSRSSSPVIAAAQKRRTQRLDEMDLDPPEGRVPDDIVAKFAQAVERQAKRQRLRDAAA
ncbi:MAG: hypothetical protein ACR2N6_02710 [Miltoncostaeaceae bacterium]